MNPLLKRACLGGLILVALGGCATVTNPVPQDPLEGWNRNVQSFNDVVDDNLLKPVARTYRDVLPQFVQTGVHNFFGNLGDGWSAVNHLLQAKPEPTLTMTMRFAVNSVLGFGGVLDIATEAGLERQAEDFGQTLGFWGVGPGPYLVLPLLGPSTLRDTAALPLDRAATSLSMFDVEGGDLVAATVVEVVDTRASLLSASRLMEQLALDRYTFLRDAFLSRRRNQVYDGNPPPVPEPRYDLEPASSGTPR